MPGMKILSILLLSLPLAVHADWGKFDFDYANERPWVELAAQLPTAPKAENLIEFNVSSATRNRHYIDAASISVGSDEVVRYTVVIDAAGGARNVLFEGMRCATAEHRTYAYGQPDGSWSRARKSGWESIKLRSLLSHRKALFEDHFCFNDITVKDAREAVFYLRNPRQIVDYH